MRRHLQSLRERSLWVIVAAVLILAPIRNSSAAAAAQDTSATGQAVAAQAASGVPRLFSFSGVIRDASGNLKTGVVTLTLSIYADLEGGTPLWSETQNVHLDDTGHYAVLVGATSPSGLPLDLFTSGPARWLGVQPAVTGVGERPRVLLLSVPYALKAADAETLGGKPLSAFQLATSESNTTASNNARSNGPQPAVTEQANEIACSSTTACKTGSIPRFSSNGGSAKVSDSFISQYSAGIQIAGNEIVGGTILAVAPISAGSTTTTAAVTGTNDVNGFGVYGTSLGAAGIWGESFATTGGIEDGVHGVAHSPGSSGVAGVNGAGGIGVYGTGGTGVFGTGSNFGFSTDSNVQQARTAGGWAKAMMFYNGFNGSIVSCFNSTLSGAAASTPPCGFNSDKTGKGDYIIDFGFQVDDRFLSLTGTITTGFVYRACTDLVVGGCPHTLTPNQVEVFVADHNANFQDGEFYLIVY
jgi:hypothetical protein